MTMIPTFTYVKKCKSDFFVCDSEYNDFITECVKEQGDICPFCGKPKTWCVRLEHWRGTRNHRFFSLKEKRHDWVVCWFTCTLCCHTWASEPFMINLKRYER